MDYNKPFNFLKNLPPKLNSFYKTKSKSGLVVSNKSKSKKDFDPVTNFDRAFEKYIRSLINKKFPNKVGLILRIVSAITGTMLVVGNAQILQTIVTSRTVLNIWFLIKDLKGLDTLYFSTEFGIFFLVLLKISNDIINEIK